MDCFVVVKNQKCEWLSLSLFVLVCTVDVEEAMK